MKDDKIILTPLDRQLIHALGDGSEAEWREALKAYMNLPAERRFQRLANILMPHSQWMAEKIAAEDGPLRASKTGMGGMGALFALSQILIPVDQNAHLFFSLFTSGLFGASAVGYALQKTIFRKKSVPTRFHTLVKGITDKNAVPMLLTMLYNSNELLRSQIFKPLCQILIRLMPEIEEKEVLSWSDGQRMMMLGTIMHQNLIGEALFDDRIRLEAIRLMETADTRRELTVLQSIAEGNAKWKPSPEMILAAVHILPVVRERINRQEQGETLLRGSSRPESIDTLLRPAWGVFDLRQAELLRPTSQEDISKEAIAGQTTTYEVAPAATNLIPPKERFPVEAIPIPAIRRSSFQDRRQFEVIQGLQSSSVQERELAMNALYSLSGDEAFKIINDLLWQYPLSDELQTRKNWQNQNLIRFAPAVGGASGVILMLLAQPQMNWFSLTGYCGCLIAIYHTINRYSLAPKAPETPLQNRLSTLLEASNDVRIVPQSLLFLNSYPGKEETLSVLKASLFRLLHRLLPEVRGEDFAAWGRDAKDALAKTLIDLSKHKRAESEKALIGEQLILEMIRVCAMDERRETLDLLRGLFSPGTEIESSDVRDAAKQAYEELQLKIGATEELQPFFEKEYEISGKQNELVERIDLDSGNRVRSGSFTPVPMEVETEAVQKIGK